MMDEITIYGKTGVCKFCNMAVKLCEEHGVEPKMVEIEKDMTKEDFIKFFESHGLLPPQTIPQIFINDVEWIGGYNNLVLYFKNRNG